MRKRTWTVAGIVVGVAGLGAAAYVAISLITTGSVGLGALQLPGTAGGNTQRHGYEVIPPTEVPQTQPDVVGPVVQVKDQSFMVQPDSKSSGGQNGPTTEVVITADTKVYQDITKGGAVHVVDGKIQQLVAPYGYNQIKAGDQLIVWGNLRGPRMVADAVIVEVSTATPAP
jgi:hypothetical protein